MTELFELGVAEASARIREGELSPVALVEACLARIESLNPALKAWETVDAQGALRHARRLEAELQQRGPRGPLHGIPVGLKDIIYTRGMRTTGGSRTYSDFVPSFDATVVAKLRRAGAIILGKTVTTEFAASGEPLSINPWNPEHTPSGSSTGSAVAVAARMCPVALGTQTGGSTLRPSAFTGVVGLKPSYGRVSKYGVIPASYSMDTVGIIVRSVEDATLVLQAAAGYDPKDPSSARRRVPDFAKALDSEVRQPRIGTIRQFFFARSTEEVQKRTEAVVTQLSEAGAVHSEVHLPESFSFLVPIWPVIFHAEAAAYHEEVFRERATDYTSGLRGSLETAAFIPAIQYIQAQRLRRQCRREMEALFRTVDVFLTPTVATPPPPLRGPNTATSNEFQSPWTNLGFPSITIPLGLSSTSLPLGIQLIAAPFAEERLLAVARWCERLLNVKLTPPEPAIERVG